MATSTKELAATMCLWLLLGQGVDAIESFSKYMVILEREPFGHWVEPKPKLPERPTRKERFDPKYRLVAVTSHGNSTWAGFITQGQKPSKSHFLRLGQVSDGIHLVEVDFEAGSALLRIGTRLARISMQPHG